MQEQPKFNELQNTDVSFDLNQNLDFSQRSYGNCLIVSRKADGEPLLVLGPHWYLFLLSFFGSILVIIIMLFSLYQDLSLGLFYTLVLTSIIYAYSYLSIGFSNPGFASPAINLQANIIKCQICGVPRINKIFHCPDCDVCIEGFDHHCPWIGKCVGAKNLHSFYFFLIMILVNIIVFFIATLTLKGSIKPQSSAGQPIVMG